MTKTRITQRTTNNPTNLPPRGVVRFDGNIQAASRGTAVSQLQPIRFTPGGEYLEQMNAIADLGEGIFNATAKIAVASQRAKEAERNAYLANVETDDIVQTNRIFNENKLQGNDPELLTKRLEEYRNGKMSSMPQDVQPYYQQSFDKRAATLTVKSQDQFFKKVQNDSQKSLEAAQELVGDDIFKNPAPSTEIEAQHYEDKITKYQSILQARIDQGFITPEEGAVIQKDFQKNLITVAYKNQLQAMDSNQRANAILELQKSKKLPAGLSIEDKNDIVAKLNAYNSTVDSIETKANAQQKAEQELNLAKQAADLEIRVNRGEATYEDVLEAEQSETITPAKKVALFKKLDDEKDKVVKESLSLRKVYGAMNGSDFIDPKNTDDKKAVDLVYTKVLSPQIDAIEDPAVKKSTIANYVNSVGVVPETLRGKMRGVFRGDDVEQKVFYADLVGRIQETKPQALDDFDNKDITQAIMIDEMVKAGTPNEQAVEKVANITSGLNKGRLEILEEDFKELVEDKGTGVKINSYKVIDTVRDTFDEGVFSVNASLPNQQLGVEAAAINDYKRLYKTWYLNTNGDAELAEKQAKLALKRTWGTTGVNGDSKQLTKYPIEQAYPGMPTKEIKKDLMKDLKSLPEYKDLADDDVIVQWDARTAREFRQYPSYQVLIFNKEGVLEPIADENLARWKPDYDGWKKRTKAANLKKNQENRAKSLEEEKAINEALSNPIF